MPFMYGQSAVGGPDTQAGPGPSQTILSVEDVYGMMSAGDSCRTVGPDGSTAGVIPTVCACESATISSVDGAPEV